MTLQRITVEPNRDTLFGLLWIATFESYDGPESPIGSGATPVEAVEALLEMAGVEA
jgi:hypothetical protein